MGNKSYPACTPVTGHVDIRDLTVTCVPHRGQADACAKSIDLDVVIGGIPFRASGTWVTAAAGTLEVKIEDHIEESTESDLDLGASH